MNLKIKAKILLGTILLTSVSNFGGIVSAANKRGHVGTSAVIRSRDASPNRSEPDVRPSAAIASEVRGRIQDFLNIRAHLSTLQWQQILEDLLCQAVEENDLDSVREILRAGADVNAADGSGWTPLNLAVAYGYNDLVQELLQFGANVNARDDDGNTVLHIWVQALRVPPGEDVILNWLFILHTLISYGVNPNIPNNDGETPLSMAERMGSTHLFNALRLARAETSY